MTFQASCYTFHQEPRQATPQMNTQLSNSMPGPTALYILCIHTSGTRDMWHLPVQAWCPTDMVYNADPPSVTELLRTTCTYILCDRITIVVCIWDYKLHHVHTCYCLMGWCVFPIKYWWTRHTNHSLTFLKEADFEMCKMFSLAE